MTTEQPVLSRRDLVGGTALAATAALSAAGRAAAEEDRERWPIGCFCRPWGSFTFDEALDDMKAAGFALIGLIGGHRGEPFLGPDAAPEYVDSLRRRIEARGLTPVIAAIHVGPERQFQEARADLRRQLDLAARLKLGSVMTFGEDRPERFDAWFLLLEDATAHAQRLGIQIVLKPHGGISATGADLLRCVERVGGRRLKIWHDAGNIIHYTGRDPVEELEPVASHVTGFCAKDCAGRGGEVMIQFGEGRVDFAAVFRRLKKAGFRGPVMIECCAPGTRAQLIQNVRANRAFLQRVLADLQPRGAPARNSLPGTPPGGAA